MSFRVVVTREVEVAIDEQVQYLRAQGAPEDRLEVWLADLFKLMEALSSWPRRWPVAEAVTDAAGYEVRRTVYGDYAIYFRVDDDARLVRVIALRHGRQRPWSGEVGE